MSFWWINTISIGFVSLLAVLASLIQFKKLDKGSRYIAIIILLAFLTETTASWAAYEYHQNNIVYNIHGPLNLFFTCLYFNEALSGFKKKNIGVIIGVIGILGAFISIYYGNRLFIFNNIYLAAKSLVVVFLCLYYFYDFLKKDTFTTKLPIHFWFTSILLIYWSFTLYFWLIGLSSINADTNISVLAIYSIFAINLIIYVCYALLFLNYNKFGQRAGD